MTRSLLLCCFALLGGNFSRALVPVSTKRSPSGTGLAALTERQMQFWEDVEDGLDDIEKFYAKKGQAIDRIRQFSKR
jgi:hypothetical protein